MCAECACRHAPSVLSPARQPVNAPRSGVCQIGVTLDDAGSATERRATQQRLIRYGRPSAVGRTSAVHPGSVNPQTYLVLLELIHALCRHSTLRTSPSLDASARAHPASRDRTLDCPTVRARPTFCPESYQAARPLHGLWLHTAAALSTVAAWRGASLRGVHWLGGG